MAYDHIADIPDTYPIEQVIDVLELHSAREAWCRIAESENYLNYIARKAIIGTIADAFSQGEVHLADLGVQIYQVATNPRLVGTTGTSEPTFCDPEGQLIVTNIVNQFVRIPTKEMPDMMLRRAIQMQGEVPELTGLVGWVAPNIVQAHLSESDLRMMRAGANVLRVFHIASRSVHHPDSTD